VWVYFVIIIKKGKKTIMKFNRYKHEMSIEINEKREESTYQHLKST